MTWSADNLRGGAKGVGASRRTDIPAFYAEWFRERLRAGWAEYVPAGPRRVVRCSLAPEDVTHFCFWSKWPRPFLPALDEVLAAGYPVLWNVTITGLGGTSLEPRVPEPARVVGAVRSLAWLIGRPEAVMWRYDPIVLSERHTAALHRRTFRELAERLAGAVGAVAVSFLKPAQYRAVACNLRAHARREGYDLRAAERQEALDLLAVLRELAERSGMRLKLCCEPELAAATGLPCAGCNSFAWAQEVYPALRGVRPLRPGRSRVGCGCSAEVDIGCYNTCPFGCVYSYGSCLPERAREAARRHDPRAPSLAE